jgi:PAS domain S-box-containing protein
MDLRSRASNLVSSIRWLLANPHQQTRELQLLQRYRLLSDITRDIILFIDRNDLTIVDANAAALQAYRFERSQLIGKPFQSLKPDDIPLDPALIARTDEAGAVFEMIHRRSDGTLFPIEIYGRTADIGDRRTIVITARDISERRQTTERLTAALDEALAASQLKSEFVATMSHEIRTPMHCVIGMSEMLLRTPLTQAQQEYADTIHESVQSLLGIVNDVLDFSKLEENKVELVTVTFDPLDAVAGVLNRVRETAREKGLELSTSAAADVPRAVRGDPVRLRQILLNLVGNAVKFTDRGSVTVSTSVQRRGQRSTDLLFEVSDTGIGIRSEKRARLFEPFVQADGTTTRRFGGTGLGLSISRRLVDLLQGRLWLEDRGSGSVFCFTARFETTAGASAPETPAPKAPFEPAVTVAAERAAEVVVKPGRAARVRILMAEDSALVRRVARSQLADLEYDVDIVTNGREAVDAFANGRYDLVLMDLRMPEMDGLAATRAIRAAESNDGRHTTIIALTANTLETDRNGCAEAGMDDFLGKPLLLDELRKALERWLPPPA